MPTPEPTSTNNNGRALIPVGPKGVELKDVDSMFRFARCYLQSNLAPASFKNEQQLVIAWAKAAELGLSPLQALEGMTIINNRVGIMGDLALAMVEASGLLEQKRVEYSGIGDTLECTVTLQRRGREAQGYSFSVKEAKAAGIYDRSPTWRNYPRRMVYYRALGFGLRDEFADILKGTKTVEELMDYPTETDAPRGRRTKVVQSVEPEKPVPVAQQNGQSATDSKSARQAVQSTNGASPLEKVRQRLEESRISEQEFLDVLRLSKIPETQSLKSLACVSERILLMSLSGWDTVTEIAGELRERRAEV
ncbi:MAG: hypothetical protein DME55_07805 [Verrucomicrobia bacterium]|nr:MAG: hypothetical protein DME55_07805 [Verrucomicrobiota bacterium]